jgi:hypothetical protein
LNGGKNSNLQKPCTPFKPTITNTLDPFSSSAILLEGSRRGMIYGVLKDGKILSPTTFITKSIIEDMKAELAGKPIPDILGQVFWVLDNVMVWS